MDSKDQGLVALHRRATNEMVGTTGWVNTGQSVGALPMVQLADALSDELEAITGWNG